MVFGIKLPQAKPEEDMFEVWDDNWSAVMIFLRCQTQWRSGGMGGVIGLDYGAVRWVFNLYQVEDSRAVLEDLQVIESAVLAGLSKKRS